MIVHGLVVHSAQPGDGGVQLTEAVMSLGSLGWVHCRVILSHDSTAALRSVGAFRTTEINYNQIITNIATGLTSHQCKFSKHASASSYT